MKTHWKLVQERIENNNLRKFQILQEELQRGQISKDDLLKLSSLEKNQFENSIKHEIKKLTDIYDKRYSKDYGKLTDTAISFFYEPPSLIYINLFLYNKGFFSYFIMQSDMMINIQKKKLEKSNYYTFFKTDHSGKNLQKIAEGDEKEEYKAKSKYGELLNIKNPIKNLRHQKTIKLKLR